MTVLIVQHTENNTLGPLEEILRAKKIPFTYVNCHQLQLTPIELEAMDGLIILGGKESAADDELHAFMKPEQQMIQNAIQNNLPVFGICLGAQMIARSLGATVEKNQFQGREVKEIGWTPLTLTDEGKADPVLSFMDGISQFQWHEDTFHWPMNAIPLATTELCARQAYKLDRPDNRTYAVQFHPEVSLTVIEDWLNTSQTLDSQEKARLWEESKLHFETRHTASYQMFEAFCDLAF